MEIVSNIEQSKLWRMLKNSKKDLDTLQRWEQTSLREFNLDKCEVINISNERSHVHNNHNTSYVPQAKYLGLIFCTIMTWNKHIDTITSLVIPNAEYSATVWNLHTK